MITSIYTGVRARGYVICASLLLLVRCDDGRFCLKMSNATPLGRGRGFRLHTLFVMPLCRSVNLMIASTTA
jgi:hypothetical protein